MADERTTEEMIDYLRELARDLEERAVEATNAGQHDDAEGLRNDRSFFREVALRLEALELQAEARSVFVILDEGGTPTGMVADAAEMASDHAARAGGQMHEISIIAELPPDVAELEPEEDESDDDLR
jgi:hypothetical protein